MTDLFCGQEFQMEVHYVAPSMKDITCSSRAKTKALALKLQVAQAYFSLLKITKMMKKMDGWINAQETRLIPKRLERSSYRRLRCKRMSVSRIPSAGESLLLVTMTSN